MEYQIVSLIDICQFNLTHLILIGQQLHVHVKLPSDDYGFYSQTLSHSEPEW